MSAPARQYRPETRLVHAGTLRSQYGETSEAIFLTQGFVYDSAEQCEARFIGTDPGYQYSRFSNPTVHMFERRMAALLSYTSQYGEAIEGGALFPNEQEIRDRLGAVARFYGNLIGVKYGEPYVVKEAIQIDDIVSMPSRSI